MSGPGGDTQFTQRFALRSHGAYDSLLALKFALEHQNPPAVVALSTTGTAPSPATNFSLLSVSDPSVLVWAIEPAEEGIGSGVIVRVWNQAANISTFSLTPNFGSRARVSASATTHVETDVAAASVVTQGGADSLSVSASAFEMRTFRLRPGTYFEAWRGQLQTWFGGAASVNDSLLTPGASFDVRQARDLGQPLAPPSSLDRFIRLRLSEP